MKKYKIYAGGNPAEIERILSILFKHGYVFTNSRVRTIEGIRRQWSSQNLIHWHWIVTAFDDECKAMMTALSDNSPYYTQITLEDFLKLTR